MLKYLYVNIYTNSSSRIDSHIYEWIFEAVCVNICQKVGAVCIFECFQFIQVTCFYIKLTIKIKKIYIISKVKYKNRDKINYKKVIETFLKFITKIISKNEYRFQFFKHLNKIFWNLPTIFRLCLIESHTSFTSRILLKSSWKKMWVAITS